MSTLLPLYLPGLFLPGSPARGPPFVAFSLLASSMASGIPAGAELRSFLVPANDGYGVADCLAEAGPAAESSPMRGARRMA